MTISLKDAKIAEMTRYLGELERAGAVACSDLWGLSYPSAAEEALAVSTPQ